MDRRDRDAIRIYNGKDTDMIYVTSDLHGYPLDDFLTMLDKAGFSDTDQLIVLGDVVDRNGEGGVETLLHLMHMKNASMLRGNHEDMLLKCQKVLYRGISPEVINELSAEETDDLLHWMRNGAEVTIASFNILARRDPDEMERLLRYLLSLPIYREVEAGGRKYVLVHAGLGNFRVDKQLEAYEPFDMIWHRPTIKEAYYPDKTVIFGHTPVWYYGHDATMLRTETWLDIDTGAAGGGSPMLLRLDDQAEFYAEET